MAQSIADSHIPFLTEQYKYSNHSSSGRHAQCQPRRLHLVWCVLLFWSHSAMFRMRFHPRAFELHWVAYIQMHACVQAAVFPDWRLWKERSHEHVYMHECLHAWTYVTYHFMGVLLAVCVCVCRFCVCVCVSIFFCLHAMVPTYTHAYRHLLLIYA